MLLTRKVHHQIVAVKKSFSVSSYYLPSRSTWPTWHCILSLRLTVDDWVIHKQQTMLGEKKTEQSMECIWNHPTTVQAPCAHCFYFILYFTRFSEGTLYLLSLVRTSCAIYFITVSIINLIWVVNIFIHFNCVIHSYVHSADSKAVWIWADCQSELLSCAPWCVTVKVSKAKTGMFCK